MSDKINYWKVLKKINHKKVLCQCVCGVIKEINYYHLIKNNSTNCGCIRRKVVSKVGKSRGLPDALAAKRSKYKSYMKNAHKRSLVWNLSFEDFLVLTSKNCYYCTAQPSNVEKAKHGNFVYNGIDRVNNNVGYILQNCVPCCKDCNYMKRDKDFEAFVEKCRIILQKEVNKRLEIQKRYDVDYDSYL